VGHGSRSSPRRRATSGSPRCSRAASCRSWAPADYEGIQMFVRGRW